MNNLQWKVIEEAENYEISSEGAVRNKKTQKILKPRYDKDGYERYNMKNNYGKVITRFSHRLVAIAFIPNLENLPLINHKDEIKTNNSVENLEWCSHRYNVTYGTARERASKALQKRYESGDCGKGISVHIYDSNKNFLKSFSTLSKAADYTGINKGTLSSRFKTEDCIKVRGKDFILSKNIL